MVRSIIGGVFFDDAAAVLFSFGEGSERPSIRRQRFWIGFVVDELSFPFRLDKAGIGKNFQVMGDGRRSDATKRDQLSAIHGLARTNSFKNE